MTTKDYIIIAKALGKAAFAESLTDVEDALVEALTKDNSRFNESIFREAVTREIQKANANPPGIFSGSR
jgi:hypothetical protein